MKESSKTAMSRRTFAKVAGATAAVTAMGAVAAGCSSPAEEKKPEGGCSYSFVNP